MAAPISGPEAAPPTTFNTIYDTDPFMMNMFKTSTAALLGTLLVACGGGGGAQDSVAPPAVQPPAVQPPAVTPPVVTPPAVTPPAVTPPAVTPPPPPATAPLAAAPGFWDGPASGASRSSAVILPDGQAWIVYESGGTVSALATAALKADASAPGNTGRYYALPNGAVQDYRFSASLPPGSAATLEAKVAIGSGAPTASTWTYNKVYETALGLADVKARWSARLGALDVQWDIDASGKLAGTSTTGCTYSGTLAPHSGAPAVLDLAVSETCAGQQQSLAGIARLSADKTRLSVVYTAAAGTRAGALVLQK